MSGVWEELLQEASLNGVPFPVESREIAGGWDFARFRFPNRPGQLTGDTGRQPRVFRLRVPMFVGVDPSWYPDGLEGLLGALTDVGIAGVVEYVDPFLGPVDVKIASWRFTEKARERDGAYVEIHLEDNDTDDLDFITGRDGSFAPRSTATTSADELDAELADAGVTVDDMDNAFAEAGAPRAGIELDFEGETMFGSLTDAFFGVADELGAAAETLDKAAAVMARRLDAVISLDAAGTATGWPIAANARRLYGAVLAAADGRDRARFRTLRVANPVSLIRLASDVYGDPSRAAEILASNAIRNPLLIEAGTVLRIPVSG